MTLAGVVLAILAQGQPVTDPELLRQLNAPPPGYVLNPPPCRNGNAECKPWERAWPTPPAPEKLGSGPHALVISDGQGMTRMDYSSGTACQNARDAVRRQTDARITNTNPNILYGAPRVTAFCVPR